MRRLKSRITCTHISLLLRVISVLLGHNHLQILFQVTNTMSLRVEALLTSMNHRVTHVIRRSHQFNSFRAITSRDRRTKSFNLIRRIRHLIRIIFIGMLHNRIHRNQGTMFIRHVHSTYNRHTIKQFTNTMNSKSRIKIRPLRTVRHVMSNACETNTLKERRLRQRS